MELKTAIKNLQKDRYVASMMREELEAVVSALDALQASKGPEVSLAKVEEKLSEALALLKGERAPANSKSGPQGSTKIPAKSPAKSRKTDRGGAGEPAPVAAKA